MRMLSANFLAVYRRTDEDRYLQLALDLVKQVHETLGRHREDDERGGWISGLDEDEGYRHPTAGGLRIGKLLPDKQPYEPEDADVEWDRVWSVFSLSDQVDACIASGEQGYRG